MVISGLREMGDMRVIARKIATVCALAAFAVGCQTGGPGTGLVGNAGETQLGANLIGESCRLRPDDRVAALGAPFNVFCGDWERPSGQVLRIADIGGGTERARSFLSAGDWRDRLERTATCAEAGTLAIAGGHEAVLLDCRLKNGGWPYVAFATSIEDDVYLAEGIPAAQPTLETAVAVLSGTAAPEGLTAEPSGSSAAVRRLEAQMGDHLFGAGDLDDYQRLMSVGRYYNSVKNFAESERRYREAVEIHQRILGSDSPELGDPLMHLALQISNQERFTVAEPLFDRAGQLIQGAFDPGLKARYTSYLSLHAANQQKYDEAVSLARQATERRRELAMASGQIAGFQQTAAFGQGGIGQSLADSGVLATPLDTAPVEIAQSQYIEAALLYRQGDLDQALGIINQAVGTIEAVGERSGWWLPQLLELRGQIQTARGAYGAAESDLRRALEDRQRLFPEERPVALTYLYLADLYRQSDRANEAVDAYRSAITIMRQGGESARLEQIGPYLDLLWAAAEADSAARPALYVEMFDAAQLVRSPVTEQNIADAAVRLSASDSDVGALIRELQDAKRQRDTLLFNFSRAASQALLPEDETYLDDLRARIEEQEQRILVLEPQVQAAAPNLNILRDTSSRFDQLQPLLRPDEALAQFLVGPDGSYVFLATSEGVQASRVPLTEPQLQVLVDRLRQAFVVTSGPSGLSVGGFDTMASNLLYQQLLGPFADRLSSVDHLLAVTSKALSSLPLSVLVASPSPEIVNADYSDVDWLIREMAISNVPSVRSFVDLRKKAGQSQAPQPFIGFGAFDPVPSADIILESLDLPEACRDGAEAVASAPRLDETAAQLRAMAASFGADPSDVILGRQFTEPTVRSLPLDQYRVLAFATHGLLPGELDCLSEPSLLTSYGASGEPWDNGLLTYTEIFNLNLDAEVVVLSACNTGGPLGAQNRTDSLIAAQGPRLVADQGESDKQRGESLTGLARAFLYAGARSLLVSNWQVSTEATVALITQTFETAAGTNRTLAESLREAQLGFARTPAASHPYLWASFTLIGDGGRQI